MTTSLQGWTKQLESRYFGWTNKMKGRYLAKCRQLKAWDLNPYEGHSKTARANRHRAKRRLAA